MVEWGWLQVVAADNGLMPPLSWRAAPHSPEDVYLLTESLHYSHALRLKATAIVLALESKCGSDAFLPIVRSLVRAALATRLLPVPLQAPSAQDAAQPPAAPAAAAAAAAPPVPWVLTSAAFLKQVSQVGGFRREIGSFAERWIYGTGCPHILGVISHPCLPSLTHPLSDVYFTAAPRTPRLGVPLPCIQPLLCTANDGTSTPKIHICPTTNVCQQKPSSLD